MYCHKLPRHDGGTWYAHLYPNKVCVSMCGSDPIIKVRVTECEETPDCYWAYWDLKDGDFSMVYPKRNLVEICFPYGSKVAVERGEGLVLPVRIEEIA
jgi:hypothetical protein